jgi:hypothetical protein
MIKQGESYNQAEKENDTPIQQSRSLPFNPLHKGSSFLVTCMVPYMVIKSRSSGICPFLDNVHCKEHRFLVVSSQAFTGGHNR